MMTEATANGECFCPGADFYSNTCLHCTNCPADLQWCPLFRDAMSVPVIELRIIDDERTCTHFRPRPDSRDAQQLEMML